jgi:superfamily II DNA or RNA helicase
MATARHPKATFFVQRHLFSGLTSFAELEQKIAALPDEQSRGAAFEVFAEAYLATQRKHDAAQVWPHGSVPLDILKNLGLTQSDQGVDGVLQTLLGQFDAYQIKFRTGRPSLTWRELSTFIGLADSPHIHSRVLLTNCDELPAVLNDRQGFFCIRGSDLDRLEAGDFRAMEAWLADAAFIAPKKSPQPHQTEALDALLPALQTQPRVSAIMACGTGKTLVALWVTERLDAKRVLVLLPSLALLRQTLHEWLRETRLPSLAYLCVCSDPTVKEGIDALATQQSDLDFQVSTDAASVRRFLDAPFAGVKMIFSTYQSASVVGDALRAGAPISKSAWAEAKSKKAESEFGAPCAQPFAGFDLAIFDEAHKTAGREGRNFAFALDDKKLAIRKRLFLTATPRHYNPHDRDREGEARLLFSMDNPAVYGPQACRLTFAEAARRGIICGYKVIISVITSEMVTNDLLSHGEVLVNGDAVRARQVANQIALRDAIEKYGVKKVFTFHRDVKSAQSFVSAGPEGVGTHLNSGAGFQPAGSSGVPAASPETAGGDARITRTQDACATFQTFHVNGSMPTARRERELRDFRAAARAVVSNARCLTEGVDVPAVDMVAFLSPRRSRVDIVQATGRAMRRSPGKTTGYVLVPLYVEQAENETIEQAIQRAEFDEVWQVLQSLQEQDEVFAGIISYTRENSGRGKGFDDTALKEQIDVLGPRICLKVLRSAITTKCVETLGCTWDYRFGQLKAYREQTGHCFVSETDSEKQLCAWVSLQRQLKRAGTLPEDRVNKLKAIGFAWGKGLKSWDEMFVELQTVKMKHGHCDLDKIKKIGLYELHGWVEAQQRKFRRGELNDGQIEKFKALGVVFEMPITDPRQAWDKMFETLVKYKQKYGDCDVPSNFSEMEYLGSWAACQRKLRSDGLLSRDLIRRLEEVGFVWDRKEYHWQKMYSAASLHLSSGGLSGLEAYIRFNGEAHTEMRKWVEAQQSAKKRKVLSRPKQSALEEIGFPWQFPKKPKVSTKPSWESVFARLVEFQKAHGHCDMKLVLPFDELLHKWAQEQRHAREDGTLTVEQVCQMDQIGFIWQTDDLLWERMLKALITYKSVHGDCNVPLYSKQDSQLAVWVASQRKRRKKGELTRLPLLDRDLTFFAG